MRQKSEWWYAVLFIGGLVLNGVVFHHWDQTKAQIILVGMFFLGLMLWRWKL